MISFDSKWALDETDDAQEEIEEEDDSNSKPLFGDIGHQSLVIGEILKFEVNVADADLDRISFLHPLAQELPSGAKFVLRVDAVQLEVSGRFSERHIDPAMRMAFAKIVADCGLVDEMEMVELIILPLMRVTIKISLGMFSFGKQFQ